MYLCRAHYCVLVFVCLFLVLQLSTQTLQQCAVLSCSQSNEFSPQCFHKDENSQSFISSCECQNQDFFYDLIANSSIASFQNDPNLICKESSQVLPVKRYLNEGCSKNEDCISALCQEWKCSANSNLQEECSAKKPCDRDSEGKPQFCRMSTGKCEKARSENSSCAQDQECDYGLFCSNSVGQCKPYRSEQAEKKVLVRGLNIYCESLYSELNLCQDFPLRKSEKIILDEARECEDDSDCGAKGSCVCGVNNSGKKHCRLGASQNLRQAYERLVEQYLEVERLCPLETKIGSNLLCEHSSETVQQLHALQLAYLYYPLYKDSGCPLEQTFAAALLSLEGTRIETLVPEQSEVSRLQVYLGAVLLVLFAAILFAWRRRQSKLLHEFQYEEKPTHSNSNAHQGIKGKSLTLENNPNSSKQLDNEIQFEDDNIEVKHQTQNNQIKKFDEEGNQLETSTDKNLNHYKLSSSSLDDSVQYSIEDDEEMSNSNVFNLEGESSRQPSSGRKRKGRRVSRKNLTGTPKSPSSNSTEGSAEKQ